MTTAKNIQVDSVLEQERLMEDAAELIAELMESTGQTQKDIAKRIGKSKGFVSQVLSGRRNMTLRTFADLASALGYRVALDATPVSEKRRYRTTSAVPVEAVGCQKVVDMWGTQAAAAAAAAQLAVTYMPMPTSKNEPIVFGVKGDGIHAMQEYTQFPRTATKGYRRRPSDAKQYEPVRSGS